MGKEWITEVVVSGGRLKVDPVFCVWPIDSNPRPGLALRLIRIQRKPTMWQKDILDNKSHFYILTSTVSGPSALISVTDWPWNDPSHVTTLLQPYLLDQLGLNLDRWGFAFDSIRPEKSSETCLGIPQDRRDWIGIISGEEKQSTGGRDTDLGFSN